MEATAEGLWGLADIHEQKGEIGKTVKCLEAICQSKSTFLPIIEIKTRLRIATLLLKHSHNINHAISHLERSKLLLKSIPSCFELKCRTYSLLSHCYLLSGGIPQQKKILHKGLELTQSIGDGLAKTLWSCNFNSQLANAFVIEGDYQSAVTSLECGLECAIVISNLELQAFFATCILHVHLMQWDDPDLVEKAVNKCDMIWDSILPEKIQQSLGLFFYNEILQVLFVLRICDYKKAAQHVEKLDAAMKAELQRTGQIKELATELNALNQSFSRPDLQCMDRSALSEKQVQLKKQLQNLTGMISDENGSMESTYLRSARQASGDKIDLAPPPIDGEWLPRNAVYSMIDLMVVITGRPKGNFKECGKRIQSGLHKIQDELAKLEITDSVRELDLQPSAIWVAGVYLMLLMQFFENKVSIDLTRSEFVEAQEALVQMKNWYIRFPTILHSCGCIVQMLRGQYAHSVGCFSEAAFHYIEAAKLTENKSMQCMCHVYAAVSYTCIGDAESSSLAHDLVGPMFGMVDSFAGMREKTCVLFAYGLLLMKQNNLQDARIRLAAGLQITHTHLGNLQLVSQYLTLLGSLALALHDTVQAREILRSSLTLAKKLYDIPTQVWVLSVLTALYEEVGEKGNELENRNYEKKRADDLRRRLADALSSIHHFKLIEKVRVEAHEVDLGRTVGRSLTRDNFDIPESIGIITRPTLHSSTLKDLDNSRRRGKRKL